MTGADNVFVVVEKKGATCIESYNENVMTDVTVTETDTPADIDAKITVNIDNAITDVVDTATKTIQNTVITAIDGFLGGKEAENKDQEEIYKVLTDQNMSEKELIEIKDRVIFSRGTEETTPMDVAVNKVVESQLKDFIADGKTTADFDYEGQSSVVTTIIKELESHEIDTKYYKDIWGILNERDWEVQLERALVYVIDGGLITLKETYAKELEEERSGEGKKNKEKKETALEEEVENKIKCLGKEELDSFHVEVETSFVEENTHFEEGLRIRLEKILIKILNGQFDEDESDFEKVLRNLVQTRFYEVVEKMRLTEADYYKIRVIIEKGEYYKKSDKMEILRNAMGDWWYNILKVPTTTATENEYTVTVDGDKVVNGGDVEVQVDVGVEGEGEGEEETTVEEDVEIQEETTTTTTTTDEEVTEETEGEKVKEEGSKVETRVEGGGDSLLTTITKNIITIFTTVDQLENQGFDAGIDGGAKVETTFTTNEEKAYEIPNIFDVNAKGTLDINGLEVDIAGGQDSGITVTTGQGSQGFDWGFNTGVDVDFDWGTGGKGGERETHTEWSTGGGQGNGGGFEWGRDGGNGKGGKWQTHTEWSTEGEQGNGFDREKGGKEGKWKENTEWTTGEGQDNGFGWKKGGKGRKWLGKKERTIGGEGQHKGWTNGEKKGWKTNGREGSWDADMSGKGGWKTGGGQDGQGKWGVEIGNGEHKVWNKGTKTEGGDWDIDFNVDTQQGGDHENNGKKSWTKEFSWTEGGNDGNRKGFVDHDTHFQGGEQDGGYGKKTVTSWTEEKRYRINPDGSRTEISADEYENGFGFNTEFNTQIDGKYCVCSDTPIDYDSGESSGYTTVTKKTSAPVVKRTVTTKTVKKASSKDN